MHYGIIYGQNDNDEINNTRVNVKCTFILKYVNSRTMYTGKQITHTQKYWFFFHDT